MASMGTATIKVKLEVDTDVIEEAIRLADREQMDGLATRTLLREVVQTAKMHLEGASRRC